MDTILANSGGLKKGVSRAIKVYEGTIANNINAPCTIDISTILATYGIDPSKISNTDFVIQVNGFYGYGVLGGPCAPGTPSNSTLTLKAGDKVEASLYRSLSYSDSKLSVIAALYMRVTNGGAQAFDREGASYSSNFTIYLLY